MVTALECVAQIAREGARLPFALEVIGFADEEGVRFSSTLLGSRAVAGTFDEGALDAADASEVTLRDAMEAFRPRSRADPEGGAARSDLLAYLELHIEQGPVLEAENLPVGVVTAISGASRFLITLEGMAGHAGTVPMHLRRDALAGAAECVLAIEALCGGKCRGWSARWGRSRREPGATNVIPGRVRFTADIRAADDDQRKAGRLRRPPRHRRDRRAPPARSAHHQDA